MRFLRLARFFWFVGAFLLLSVLLNTLPSFHNTSYSFAESSLYSHNQSHIDRAMPQNREPGVVLDMLGSYGGSISTVVVADSYVYVGQGGTLALFAMEPTAVITPVARLPLASFIQDIVVEENIAYVAVGEYGLQLVDVRNPDTPFVAGHIALNGFATAIRVIDDQAYVTTTGFGGGLKIVDVSSVSSPRLIGSLDTLALSSAVAIDTDSTDHYAYIASGRNKTLNVVDISHPISLTLTGALTMTSQVMDVQVVGDIAYVAADSAGVLIVDLSDPIVPTLLETIDIAGNALAIDIQAYEAYVATETNGFALLDMQNPKRPQYMTSYELPGACEDVASHPDTASAYVAASGSGLYMLDVSNPVSITQKTHVDTIYGAKDVFVADQVAYVAAGMQGIYSVDVAQPENSQPLSHTLVNGAALGVDMHNDLLYVAGDREGIQIFDASNPMSLTLRGGLDVTGRANDIQVVDELAYVATGDTGVQIVDVSNPTTPTLRGIYDTPGSALALHVVDDVLAVVDMTSTHLLDITNPFTPTLQTTVEIPDQAYAQDIYVSGDLVYIATVGIDGGLKILDMSKSDEPEWLGMTQHAAASLQIVDTLAYVATVDYGVEVFDISTPTTPTLRMQHQTPGVPQALSVLDDTVYVADFSGGLHILHPKMLEEFVFLPQVIR